MGTARREISELCGEVSSLRGQTGRLERERKYAMEVLERGAISIVGRSLVLTVRADAPYVERRMRAHPTWQLDRVYVSLPA